MLISVSPSGGPGVANHIEFKYIRVAPTWDVLPAEAGIGPVLQPEPIKVDPGRVRLCCQYLAL